MSVQTIPHEETDNVTVWDLSDWSGDPNEIEGAEDEWLDVVSRPEIDTSILVFGEETELSAETQEYVADQWTELTERADIERSAYVSPGLTSMAITANVDSSGVDIDSFSDLGEAMAWARA